jgi:hypothetical protein
MLQVTCLHGVKRQRPAVGFDQRTAYVQCLATLQPCWPAHSLKANKSSVFIDPASILLLCCCNHMLQVTCPHGIKRQRPAASFNRGPGIVRPVLAANLSKLRINRPTPLQG